MVLKGESTRSVHEDENIEHGSISIPIYQSATFQFATADDVARAVKGELDSYVYSRWSNPTVSRLESKLASLEYAEDSAFFSSGMAAISTAILSFAESGSHIVAIRDLYGETYRLIHDFLPKFGVESTLVDTMKFDEMKSSMRKNTRIIYIETPTNPTLKLVDIARVAKLAKSSNSILMVDNTFASPLNQNPLRLGADLVLHSATKYLNGHSDVIAGAVAGNREKIARIKIVRRILGGVLDPHAAWLVLRGIKTMAARIRVQNRNAELLASFLSKHKKVRAVNYPGLKSNPQYYLAKRQMRGYGGMLSFEIKGGIDEAKKFIDSLKVAKIAASLGGVETLVAHPATLTHAQLSKQDREKAGISDSLIRVSVGIEDVEDIINDFEQALSKL